MSELDALALKISAISSSDAEFDGVSRVISTAGVPDPLVAILLEIDDTVLERRLVFSSDSASVSLIVAGRRLRGIHSTSPSSDAPIIGKVLARDATDDIVAVQQVLSAMLGDAARLTVHSQKADPFGKGDERGISSAWLADIWQESGVAQEAQSLTPMGQFLRKAKPTCTSLLHVEGGDVVLASGNYEVLQKIWNTQVAKFRKMHLKALRGEEGPQLISLEGALEDGSVAALAIYDKEIALVACSPAAIDTLNASWSETIA